jgi:hypothetical protein
MLLIDHPIQVSKVAKAQFFNQARLAKVLSQK